MEIESTVFLKKIAVFLEYAIYVPNDYIIYKDDIGEEMYFIIDGKVKILSQNESQVIKTLEKGSFFGEIALFISGSRRICSVVAETFCHLYILKKKDLSTILNSYPKIEEKFRLEGTWICFMQTIFVFKFLKI